MDKTFDPIIRHGDLVVDLCSALVMRQGKQVHLSIYEYRLLLFLLQNVGQVLSRNEIQAQVWHEPLVSLDSLHVAIHRLRRKIGREKIRSINRQGYVLDEVKI
jgi:DNA-binding response OmpR family regulator